jgi:hypothetical protein
VARYSLLLVGIYAACARFSVGRIAKDQVEIFARRRGLPKIAPAHLDSVVEMIFADVSLGQFGQFGLNLKGGDFVLRLVFVGKYQSDYAAAGPKLDNPVVPSDVR